jgi:hypothetical protein
MVHPSAEKGFPNTQRSFWVDIILDLAQKVRKMNGQAESDYGPRRAAYDLKKLRGQSNGSQDWNLTPL